MSTVTLEKKPVTRNGKTYLYWTLRWPDPRTGKKRSKSLGQVKKVPARVAKAKRDQFQAEMFATPGIHSGTTLRAYTDQYVTNRKALGKSAGTILIDERAILILLSHFKGSTPISKITKSDARAFWSALLEGNIEYPYNSTSYRHPGYETSKKHMRVIRAIFNQAEEDELIQSNPFKVIKDLKGATREWRYVKVSEFWKMYNVARPGINTALALARLGSISKTDIKNLKWSNVNLDNREITFNRHKTGVLQVVPICDELHLILSELPRDNDHVLPSQTYIDNLSRDIKVITKHAGVPSYRDPLHGLRKSCITDWVADNPPHVVKTWAGHADIKTTLTYYAKPRDVDMEKGKAKFSPKFSPNTTKNTTAKLKLTS